jgi:hypothetical protein
LKKADIRALLSPWWRARGRVPLLAPALLRTQGSVGRRRPLANIVEGLCVGLLAACLVPLPALAESATVPLPPALQNVSVYQPKRANFERERASREARHIADWVVDSGDNRGLPFMIVDKVEAKVFQFSAQGQLSGAAPALLGLARGDDSVPGIGERKLSSIRPEERTTPAGRFVAAIDRSLTGEQILWVDYDTAVSLHRVINVPRERRLERLASPTPDDNRISFGCINVPAKFFDNVVLPAFTATDGIVYVLPETRSARSVFASYDVDDRQRQQTAGMATAPGEAGPSQP